VDKPEEVKPFPYHKPTVEYLAIKQIARQLKAEIEARGESPPTTRELLKRARDIHHNNHHLG